MANPEHLERLLESVAEKNNMKKWNEWRRDYPTRNIDLSDATLDDLELNGSNLLGVNLSGANLSFTSFKESYIRFSSFTRAFITNSSFMDAVIIGSSFENADLSFSNLIETKFTASIFLNTNFNKVTLGYTEFAEIDLSKAINLKTVMHEWPSSIGIDTIYASKGKIPEEFLRGCGVPDTFIEYMPSLVGAMKAIDYYSAFISYSHKDEEFAKRLYSKMRDEHLRVWYAPEDMKSGEKIHEQIDTAIRMHDKLLIVLSEESMNSNWVQTELKKAFKRQREDGKRKLFPISIASSFDKIRAWECFDGDSGIDLAVELREYYIPDFSNWKDHDAFEKTFKKLLDDLKASEEVSK